MMRYESIPGLKQRLAIIALEGTEVCIVRYGGIIREINPYGFCSDQARRSLDHVTLLINYDPRAIHPSGKDGAGAQSHMGKNPSVGSIIYFKF